MISTRTGRYRVVGALSMVYGVLLTLLWAWLLLKDGGLLGGGVDAREVLQYIPFLAAPLLLLVTGYASLTPRLPAPDARVIQVTTIVVLVLKVALGAFWAIRLFLVAGHFPGLVYPAALLGLAVEVLPSLIWAVVLFLTPIPAEAPPDSETVLDKPAS